MLQSREKQGCMVIINDYLNFGHIVLILKFIYSILQSLTKQWCIGYLKIVDYALHTVNIRAEIILANTFIFRIPRLFIFVSWPVRPARTFATTGEGTARDTVPLVLLSTTGSSYCPFLPKMAPSVLMHHFFLYCPTYAFVFLICFFQHFSLFSPSFFGVRYEFLISNLDIVHSCNPMMRCRTDNTRSSTLWRRWCGGAHSLCWVATWGGAGRSKAPRGVPNLYSPGPSPWAWLILTGSSPPWVRPRESGR